MPIEGTRRGSGPAPRRRHLHLIREGSVALLPASEGPRRILNVAVALVGILLTLPLWILIAIAIKLTSRGPVIYTQTRVGIDKRATGIRPNDPRRRQDIGGRPFKIYKFRTMTVDAERGIGAVWASMNDCRVTAVGRRLRQFRLDEFPQLINVLRGEMNVVGPRPERPAIVADLRGKIPEYQVRQRVRPGITGHAQVNLEYDSSLEDVKQKVGYDLDYISRQGFWPDLWIMAQTIPVMLFRRGSR
jgi:lipopolysaccharide/colanic/teichoic acid biosynthesis glycosyltransferase